jgi:hypothetical protein
MKTYDPVWHASQGGTYRGSSSDMREYEDGEWVKLEDVNEILTALQELVDECRLHRTSPPDYAWSECICGEEKGHEAGCPVAKAMAVLSKSTTADKGNSTE